MMLVNDVYRWGGNVTWNFQNITIKNDIQVFCKKYFCGQKRLFPYVFAWFWKSHEKRLPNLENAKICLHGFGNCVKNGLPNLENAKSLTLHFGRGFGCCTLRTRQINRATCFFWTTYCQHFHFQSTFPINISINTSSQPRGETRPNGPPHARLS